MTDSARLKKLARAHMSAHPGTRYQQALAAVSGGEPADGSRLDCISAVRAEIDALIGQDAAKQQLGSILAGALADAERSRRGLRVASGHSNFVFTGAPGTGKSYAGGILADALHAAGIIETSKVVHAHRSTLVGAVEGETSAKTAAVFEGARHGVLFVHSANDLVQYRGSHGDPFGREAVDTLGQLIRSQEQHTVVVLSGFPESMHQFLAREQGLAGLFSCHVAFTSFLPAELWRYVVTFAENGGYILTPGSDRTFQAVVERLGESGADGYRLIDRLGNIRFARNVVEQAAGIAVRRVQAVDDNLSALTDEDLMQITSEDIISAAEQVAGTVGVTVG